MKAFILLFKWIILFLFAYTENYIWIMTFDSLVFQIKCLFLGEWEKVFLAALLLFFISNHLLNKD